MNNVTKDFNGLPIVFREDGYINMTKAAKHFGKDLSNFWRLPSTQEYLYALADMAFETGNSVKITELPGGGYSFTESKKGRYGGTFCHPKLAVFFARWLDVRFAVWCDLMIDNILQGNIQTSVVVPTVEAVAESSTNQNTIVYSMAYIKIRLLTGHFHRYYSGSLTDTWCPVCLSPSPSQALNYPSHVAVPISR